MKPITNAVVLAIIFITAVQEAKACSRRDRVYHFCPMATPPLEVSVPSLKPALTAEDARNALIAYLDSDERAKGAATFLNGRPNRNRLRDELRASKISGTDGDLFVAGFQISVRGKSYAITMEGNGFIEDYIGEFAYEHGRWIAKAPKLESIGHFK